jgi:hypothetical protein
MYSPADNCQDGPDRKAHGDLPMLAYDTQLLSLPFFVSLLFFAGRFPRSFCYAVVFANFFPQIFQHRLKISNLIVKKLVNLWYINIPKKVSLTLSLLVLNSTT